MYHLSNCSTAARVGMAREIHLQQQFPGDAPAAPDEPVTSSGTGFFVSTDGLLLTANHMVDEAKVIKVTLSDGSIAEAKVEAADPPNDLALLSIGKKSPAHLSLAAPRSAKLQINEPPNGVDGVRNFQLVASLVIRPFLDRPFCLQ